MRRFQISFLLLLGIITFEASAGVVIGGSRMVYEGNKKEQSITVENLDSTPFLIQSWIEDASGKMLNSPPQFFVTPPLFRLDGRQKNILRIINSMKSLPQDKESLFWLNIKSIPAKSDEDKNSLQIAVRSRLKLIYRPDSLLNEVPEEFSAKLVWHRQGNVLTVDNPSKYFMNFMSVKINNVKISDGGFVGPESAMTFTLPANNLTGDLSWTIINDFGGTGPAHHFTL